MIIYVLTVAGGRRCGRKSQVLCLPDLRDDHEQQAENWESEESESAHVLMFPRKLNNK